MSAPLGERFLVPFAGPDPHNLVERVHKQFAITDFTSRCDRLHGLNHF